MHLRSIYTLLAMTLVSASVNATSAPLTVCPFTSQELQTALGVAFDAGKGDPELSAGGAIVRSCRYASKRYSLRLETTTYAANPEQAKTAFKMFAGKQVPVPNDPDGAVFQEGQGDLTAPTVHYVRNGVVVSIRIMGNFYDEPRAKPAAVVALREKLAKLRRLP